MEGARPASSTAPHRNCCTRLLFCVGFASAVRSGYWLCIAQPLQQPALTSLLPKELPDLLLLLIAPACSGARAPR